MNSKADSSLLTEVVTSIIPRGDNIDSINSNKIDLEKLANQTVYDELGNKKKFCDLYREKKTIVIFIRHFLCFFAFDYVEDLQRISKAALENAGVQVIIIGCAPFRYIREFKKDTKCPFTIYCDPERDLYKILGCQETSSAGVKTTPHVKGSYLMGVLRSTMRAMRHCEWQGDPKTQGASLVLGPGNHLHFSHIDSCSSDHMRINDLLLAVGLEPVNFKNDERVITV